MITEEEVIHSIKSDVNLTISCLDTIEYPLPKSFLPDDITQLKAIVLGSDPSNFSKDGKTNKIQKVFDIGGDKRYFNTINQNLFEIGLSIENVFVQNMVRNYMDYETASNTKWELFAIKWLPYIRQELEMVDPQNRLPVLVTAEVILKFLVYDTYVLGKPTDYYTLIKTIPIRPSENRLERNLIPFYRSQFYLLKKQDQYKEKIKSIIKTI